MIGTLRGTLVDTVIREGSSARDLSAEVTIETSGVGYRISVPGTTLSKLPSAEAETFMYIHTHVREDAISLYGFATRDERNCFEILLNAHGVGPSVALAILSHYNPNDLRAIVATDDADAFSQVSGIGKKTAARLIIDLKTPLSSMPADSIDLDAISENGDNAETAHNSRNQVRSALQTLGYSNEEIRAALQTLPSQGSVEELLRNALQELVGSK